MIDQVKKLNNDNYYFDEPLSTLQLLLFMFDTYYSLHLGDSDCHNIIKMY